MTTIPWFQPTTIDGSPRRAFFERVPEARPVDESFRMLQPEGDPVCHSCGLSHSGLSDLCRAAVDRWARGVWMPHSPWNIQSIANSVLIANGDAVACDDAHRLADALEIKP